MDFDFKNIQLPALRPLKESFTQNDREAELRDLFIEVFRQKLAAAVYDVNVFGAAHLGSLPSVRKSVNWDGLAMLPNQPDDEAAKIRYLYRAWQSRDVQGRGVHFLRTYLQLLYPNLTAVNQLWQEKDKPYPLALHSGLDQDDDLPIDPATMFLTSRLQISLDLSVSTSSITQLTNIFRTILPARLVPQFLFRLLIDVALNYEISTLLFMEKHSEVKQYWCGRYVTTNPYKKWRLGKEGAQNAPRLGKCAVRYSGEYFISTELEALPAVRLISTRPEHIWRLGKEGAPDAPRLTWARVEFRFEKALDFVVDYRRQARLISSRLERLWRLGKEGGRPAPHLSGVPVSLFFGVAMDFLVNGRRPSPALISTRPENIWSIGAEGTKRPPRILSSVCEVEFSALGSSEVGKNAGTAGTVERTISPQENFVES